MARLNLLIVLVLSSVALSQCGVIYKKYRKTLPTSKPHEKEVEEIYEVFHTYRRPPMYGHSERFINNFLATDYNPKEVHPQWNRPSRITTPRPTVAPVVTTEEPWTTTTEKRQGTTQSAIHPELEIEAVETQGGGQESEWVTTTEEDTTTEDAATTTTTTTTEAITTTTEDEYDNSEYQYKDEKGEEYDENEDEDGEDYADDGSINEDESTTTTTEYSFW
uniref:Putative secreted protein n=1 Tax=Lutzomyia longipalpis TaxID=7200 RepID=A0A1B0CAJ3_LUTLO